MVAPQRCQAPVAKLGTPPEWVACTRCPLHQTRINLVYGVGSNPKAKVMLIGEGPGQLEDEWGEPFVGPAGHLLNKLLRQVGLTRAGVYITNVVCCRPPNNREPEVNEILACLPRLEKQIQQVNPKVLIALGKTAIETLTCRYGAVSSFLETPGLTWRPRTIQWVGEPIPVVPMYHPSFLLRNLRAPNAGSLIKDALTRLGGALRLA